MIGKGGTDLSNYLINFNSSDWANQANAQLQSALQQGMQFSEKYNQQAVNAVQDYQKVADNQMKQGFNQSQALNAPQHLATYNALDAYQGTLGLPTPVGGSFQLAQGMQNGVLGNMNTPQQAQQAAGYNQGVQNVLPAPQGLFAPQQGNNNGY
jgi:hypothetical protein